MANIFEGVRVLDFTSNLAGPGSTALLADFGAEVIKVERPIAGDDIRGVSPRMEGQALFHHFSNRGKKSIVLALDDPRSKELLYKMIQDTDIIAESYKPGQMKKFGLDYESVVQIKPDIIYMSVSACGQTGGYSKKPGYDVIAQGMSGIMDLNGDPSGPPARMGVPVGDYVGALNAAFAMAAALYHKMRTGEGQHLDISLLDGMVGINSMMEGALNLGTKPSRTGNHYANMAPYGVYNGNNGQSCVISAYSPKGWNSLCAVMGRPDFANDPLVADNTARTKNIKYLVENVEAWLKQYDDINEPIAMMEAAGIACCKIKSTSEVSKDDVLWERGTLVEVETPPSFKENKTVKRRGPWIKMSKTPALVKRAPDLGEDSVFYLTQYGLSEQEVLDLEQSFVDAAKAKKKK